MAFADLSAELSGTLPGLSPLLADNYINRAWVDVQRERRWSFLTGIDGAIVCPAQITAGAVAIVQYASTLTCDATASAALTPYITSTPLLTQMQIRFGGSNTLSAGQIYRIMSVDATAPTALILTLNRMIVEPTSATATYQCYRCYVTPPQENFLAWDSIVDMTFGFTLRKNYTSAQFDIRDPQRTSQGDAYYCGYYQPAQVDDPNNEPGSPIYELWPHPTMGRSFYARMVARGQAFTSPSDTQPGQITDALILHRAYGWWAYPFAQANVANFPTLKHLNWPTLIAQSMTAYREELRQCKRNDDATGLGTVYNRGRGLRGGSGLPFPVDAAFIQSHLLPF